MRNEYKDSCTEKRSTSTIEKREAVAAVVVHNTVSLSKPECYKSYSDFLQRIQKLKLQGWVGH